MRFGEMLCAVVLVLSTQSMRETGRSVCEIAQYETTLQSSDEDIIHRYWDELDQVSKPR